MASTREIRRRIRSVRNISQITRAMEMVSASKMRRSQQRVLASRPYADRIEAMIGDLAEIQFDQDEISNYPLLSKREIRNVQLVLITPDKGLTGAMTSNVIRRATKFILEEAEAPTQVVAVGKKGLDFMVRTRQNVVAEFTGLSDQTKAADIGGLAQVVLQDYESERVDAVYLCYSQFVNTLTQVPTIQQLLADRT